ncbi:hypothetical protein G9A89_005987 [Geosiphon pyriformis]|nr:hypothetical protein G9A89_005987 [Geosiphon pyriformis]
MRNGTEHGKCCNPAIFAHAQYLPICHEEHAYNSFFELNFSLAASFICASLNALSAGSLYLFSLYGPQLSKEFGYFQVQLSVVASAGNNYLGPLMGWLVDVFGKDCSPIHDSYIGPRRISFVAAITLFIGYSSMAFTHNHTFVNISYVVFVCIIWSKGSINNSILRRNWIITHLMRVAK